jgi:hypothetical protein
LKIDCQRKVEGELKELVFLYIHWPQKIEVSAVTTAWILALARSYGGLGQLQRRNVGLVLLVVTGRTTTFERSQKVA